MNNISYGISGIWFEDETANNRIAHVMLHAIEEGRLYTGLKTTVSDIARLILGNNAEIRTLVWDYKARCWQFGATVQVHKSGGNVLLYTHKDEKIEHQLSNIIRLNHLFTGLE